MGSLLIKFDKYKKDSSFLVGENTKSEDITGILQRLFNVADVNEFMTAAFDNATIGINKDDECLYLDVTRILDYFSNRIEDAANDIIAIKIYDDIYDDSLDTVRFLDIAGVDSEEFNNMQTANEEEEQ